MKSISIAIAGALVLPVGLAFAGVDDPDGEMATYDLAFFDDRALFEAAASNLRVEDFEEGKVFPNSVTICTDPYDSNTSGPCWNPGDIERGVTLGSSLGEGMAIIGDGFWGLRTTVTGAETFDNFTYLEFPAGVLAVGFDLAGLCFEMVPIRIYGSAGLLGETSAPADYFGYFWGVVSTTVITRIEIGVGLVYSEVVDNLAFGGTLFSDGFECGDCSEWAMESSSLAAPISSPLRR